jgi:DNA-binding beta-propeller fold protein YncE
MAWRSSLVCLLAACTLVHAAASRRASAQAPRVPRFEIDPFWPKTLPNNYYMGELGAVFVDSKDHVWIVSRPRTLTADQIGASLHPPTAECCVPAPPVMEFDPSGVLVQTWGGPGPGYEWPDNEHGIFVDARGNVWLGGNTTNSDNQILKFTHDGKFVMQIGHAKKSTGSLDTDNLNRPAQIWVHDQRHEVFVADGYQNRRVIVFDADTGAFKRMWGAYGNKPDDSYTRDRISTGPRGPEQFNIVHGVAISNDDLVYVSDRVNNCIQVFTLEGTFVKEGLTPPSREATVCRSFSTGAERSLSRLVVVGSAGAG